MKSTGYGKECRVSRETPAHERQSHKPPAGHAPIQNMLLALAFGTVPARGIDQNHAERTLHNTMTRLHFDAHAFLRQQPEHPVHENSPTCLCCPFARDDTLRPSPAAHFDRRLKVPMIGGRGGRSCLIPTRGPRRKPRPRGSPRPRPPHLNFIKTAMFPCPLPLPKPVDCASTLGKQEASQNAGVSAAHDVILLALLSAHLPRPNFLTNSL